MIFYGLALAIYECSEYLIVWMNYNYFFAEYVLTVFLFAREEMVGHLATFIVGSCCH